MFFFSLHSGSDPNQHILDTLEQCISVIVEKMPNMDESNKSAAVASLVSGATMGLANGGHTASSSRMSSLDYRINDGKALDIATDGGNR